MSSKKSYPHKEKERIIISLLKEFKAFKKSSNQPMSESYFKNRESFKENIKELTKIEVFYTEIEWTLKLLLRVSQFSKRLYKKGLIKRAAVFEEKVKSCSLKKERTISLFDEAYMSFYTQELSILSKERADLIHEIKNEFNLFFSSLKEPLFWDRKSVYRKEQLQKAFSFFNESFSVEMSYSLSYLFWSFYMQRFMESIANNEEKRKFYFTEYKEVVKKVIRSASILNLNKKYDIDQGGKQTAFALSSYPTEIEGVYYNSKYPNSYFAYFKDYNDAKKTLSSLSEKEKFIYGYGPIFFMKKGE